MSKRRVEFDTHKVVKQEKEISFTKKDGTPVDFEAKVPTIAPLPPSRLLVVGQPLASPF